MQSHIEFPRDVCTIIRCGWTPQELYGLVPNTGSLSSSHPSASVHCAVADRLSPSLSTSMDFEHIHNVLNPMNEPSAEEHQNLLHNSTSKKMSAEIGLRPTTTPDLATKFVRLLDPLNLFADSSAEGGVTEVLYRVTTDTQGASRVTVERFQSHIFWLIQCITQVFPHVALPLVERSSDVQAYHLDILLEAISDHGEEFSSFLPVLFFLFETRQRNFQNFFMAVPDSLRVAREQEELPFATKQKTFIPWLSSGSSTASSKPPPLLSTKEELEFVKNAETKFPYGFYDHHRDASRRCESTRDLSANAWLLEEAIQLEIEAMGSVCDALVDAPPTISGPDWLKDDELDSNVNTAQTAVCDFLSTVRMQQQHVALPLVSMLTNGASALSSRTAAQQALGSRLVRSQQWILARSEGLNKKSGQELKDMKAVLEKKRGQCEAMMGSYAVESAAVEMRVKEALNRTCVYVSSSTHHLCDPYAPRHHSHNGRADDDEHPVLSCFDSSQ